MSRNSYHPLALARLGTVVAGQSATQAVLLSLVPILSGLVGINLSQLGALMAVGTACLMIAGPLWGQLSDRVGRRPVVLIGLGGALLSQLGFSLIVLLLAREQLSISVGLTGLVLCRVLYGFSSAGVYPAAQAWAVELSSPLTTHQRLARISASANGGRALGPMLVFPALLIGPLGPLLWIVILPAIGLLFTRSMPSPLAQPAAAMTDTQIITKPARILLLIAFLATLVVAQLQLMLGPVLLDQYQFSPTQASSGTALLMLLIVVIMGLVQWKTPGPFRHPRLALRVGASLTLLGLVVMTLSLGSPWALAGLGLFALGFAGLVPAYTALLSAQSGSRQGRLFGWVSLVHTSGYTCGFLIAGWLYERALSTPLLATIGIGVLITGIALKLPGGREPEKCDSPT